MNAANGRPLSGVHVRLFSGSNDGLSRAYGAVSDSAGHFSMASVQSGQYILNPERNGFVLLRAGTDPRPVPTLVVKPGQRLTDLKVEMAPRAIIAGRVVDEFGDPVANVPILTEAAAPGNSGMRGMMGRVLTDDRGEFRIRTAPGKYRVRAMPYPRQIETPEVRTDGTSEAVYGPTYYPSTANKAEAALVDAVAGGDVGGIEIRLVRQERGGVIGGAVSGVPQGVSGANVMLQSGINGDRFTGMQGRGTRQDGKFSFSGLEPGTYRLVASYRSANQELQSAIVEVRLTGSDVTNVDLTLAPGAELSGTMELGGVPPGKRAVRLESDSRFYSSPRSGEIDANGAFRIANVLPGKYRVRVEPLPENAYIHSLVVDGAAASELDLSRGARDVKLKIALGANGASVSGAVLDQDGEPLVTAIGWVSLMAHADDNDPDRRARVTPEGRYSFKSIRPGKYRLLAMDPFRSGAFDNESEHIRKAFEAAAEIEIKAGDRIAKDVKLAGKEDRGANR